MFAYCGNNPTLYADRNGRFLEIVIPIVATWFDQVVAWWESGGRETTIETVEVIETFIIALFVEDALSSDLAAVDRTDSKEADNIALISGDLGLTTPASPPDPNGNRDNRSWKKVNDPYLKKQLQMQGTDPHALKYDHLGKHATISLFDIYVDTNSGQLGIFSKSGELVALTDYYIGG